MAYWITSKSTVSQWKNFAGAEYFGLFVVCIFSPKMRNIVIGLTLRLAEELFVGMSDAEPQNVPHSYFIVYIFLCDNEHIRPYLAET